MWWVVGIVILVLLVASAGFRKFAGVLILVCIAGGFMFWQYNENEEKQSKKRILPSELLFEDVSLKTTYGSYDMVGRITNNSKKFTLEGVQLKLTFKDCDKDDLSNCIVIAEENKYIYKKIPPGQARDFKKAIYLSSDMDIKGKMIWSYYIEYTKAE